MACRSSTVLPRQARGAAVVDRFRPVGDRGAERGDVDGLFISDKAPGMPFAHPTVEHFAPLFVTLGAVARPGDRPATRSRATRTGSRSGLRGPVTATAWASWVGARADDVPPARLAPAKPGPNVRRIRADESAQFKAPVMLYLAEELEAFGEFVAEAEAVRWGPSTPRAPTGERGRSPCLVLGPAARATKLRSGWRWADGGHPTAGMAFLVGLAH